MSFSNVLRRTIGQNIFGKSYNAYVSNVNNVEWILIAIYNFKISSRDMIRSWSR